MRGVLSNEPLVPASIAFSPATLVAVSDNYSARTKKPIHA